MNVEEAVRAIVAALQADSSKTITITISSARGDTDPRVDYPPVDNRARLLRAIERSGECGISSTMLARVTQKMRADERRAALEGMVASGEIVSSYIEGKTKSTWVWTLAR